MPGEPGLYRVATERVHLPPMTFEDTFHWDGVGPMSRDGGPIINSKHTLPSRHATRSLPQAPCEIQCQMAMGWHAGQSLTGDDLYPVRSSAPQATDWAREAAGLTVSLNQRLFLAAARDAIPGVTGELVWVYRKRQAQCITLYTHPVLLVRGASEWHQPNRIEIVPHLHAGDPLLHHISLVLQAAIEAEGVLSRLYAEALTHALASHLLRRYAAWRSASNPTPRQCGTPLRTPWMSVMRVRRPSTPTSRVGLINGWRAWMRISTRERDVSAREPNPTLITSP
jgi:hypothetical protein